VGESVGVLEGRREGVLDGRREGDPEGAFEGPCVTLVGERDGAKLGKSVGFRDGRVVVGVLDGLEVLGDFVGVDDVGCIDGWPVGIVGANVVGLRVVGFVGNFVGAGVGFLVGVWIGLPVVGDSVGTVGEAEVGLGVMASNITPFSG